MRASSGPAFFPSASRTALRCGAAESEISLGAARAAECQAEPEVAILKAIVIGVWSCGTLVHLLGQACQVRELSAAAARLDEDGIGIAVGARGQPLGPGADLPRPGFRQLTGG